MTPLRFTLVSDGPTDANLIPIIEWMLKEAAHRPLSVGVWADFWRLERPPRNLVERIRRGIEMYPCDVLFIHRDAERESVPKRHLEIEAALSRCFQEGPPHPAVAVVPVRILEAWLTFDEAAIRRASGNPKGVIDLILPRLQDIENRPDPKRDLREALIRASELTGRRRKKFNAAAAFWRITDFVADFSPLRQLPAFQIFEATVSELGRRQWAPGYYRG